MNHQQKKYPNNIQNLYKGYTTIIKEKEELIRKMGEEILQLKSQIYNFNIQNNQLKLELNHLIEELKHTRKEKTVIFNMYSKIHQENKEFVQNFSFIQKENLKIKKANKILTIENIQLKNSISEITSKNLQLIVEINELKEKYPKLFDEYNLANTSCSTNNEFLDLHYQNTVQNQTRKRNYFPLQIQEISTIISFVGKSWYFILQQIFDVPNYRTVQRYRIKYMEKFNITSDVFDGKLENLKKLKNIFINSTDLRYVISIDAVSLKSYVSISKDGTVSGLKMIKKILEYYANIFLSSESQFNRFVEMKKSQIEKYVFVIYLCALNPNSKSFPVALVPDIKGNCTDDVFNFFLQVKNNLLNLGIDIVGQSFDGDTKYFDLLEHKYNLLLNIQNYDFKSPFNCESIFEEHNFMFSDTLHILKCVRYRYVNEIPIFCFLTDKIPTIKQNSFMEIGVPYYLLDSHKAKKMEDNLPKKLFRFKYLYSARKHTRMDLYFALFPFVMLCEAIFNEDLTIENRYECIEKGFSFVLIYSICLENYFAAKNKNADKKLKKTYFQQMKKSKNCVGITLLDKQTCMKYLTLTASLLGVIYQEKETSIGSLGTHFTEHFLPSSVEFHMVITDPMYFYGQLYLTFYWKN